MSISATTGRKPRYAFMSNRPVFFFCVSVRIEGKHGFRMFLPIPLGILRSLSDMAEDIGYIWRLFKGKKKETPPSAQARDPIRNVYHGQNQTPERRIGESVIDFFRLQAPKCCLPLVDWSRIC